MHIARAIICGLPGFVAVIACAQDSDGRQTPAASPLERLRRDPASAEAIIVEARKAPRAERRQLLAQGGSSLTVPVLGAAFARLQGLKEPAADRWCLEILHGLPTGHDLRMRGPAFVAQLWRDPALPRLVEQLGTATARDETEMLAALLATLGYRKKTPELSAQLWRLVTRARGSSWLRALAVRALAGDTSRDSERKAAQLYLTEKDGNVRAALLALVDPAVDPRQFAAVAKRHESIVKPAVAETRAFLRLAAAAKSDDGLAGLRNGAIYARGIAERTLAVELLVAYVQHSRFLDVVKEVRDLQVNEPDVRAAMQTALLQLLAASKEPRALELFVPALHDADPAVRVAAIYELRNFSGDQTLPLYQRLMRDKAPRVILGSIWGLEATRRAEAIDVILDELEPLSRIGGAAYRDAVRALTLLTGEDLGPDPAIWQVWRRKQATLTVKPRTAGRRVGRTVVKSFFDHRIYSHRPLFVVDVSTSMDTAAGFLTRREILYRELDGALGALDETARFQVIAFDGQVHPWPEGPQEAAEESIARASRFLRGLSRGGGTNYHAALQAALATDEFDTLYFLSDGQPSSGEITDPAALTKWFRRANLERGLVVHTVGIADDGGLLRTLAVENGGLYRPMRREEAANE